MTVEELRATLRQADPPRDLTAPLAALWWDAHGDWARAHGLVDELETPEGMAVHAYLHRKEGEASNADYWYQRAGRGFYREKLEDEWTALAEGLLSEVSGKLGA
jgi:hypothetical protein